MLGGLGCLVVKLVVLDDQLCGLLVVLLLNCLIDLGELFDSLTLLLEIGLVGGEVDGGAFLLRDIEGSRCLLQETGRLLVVFDGDRRVLDTAVLPGDALGVLACGLDGLLYLGIGIDRVAEGLVQARAGAKGLGAKVHDLTSRIDEIATGSRRRLESLDCISIVIGEKLIISASGVQLGGNAIEVGETILRV